MISTKTSPSNSRKASFGTTNKKGAHQVSKRTCCCQRRQLALRHVANQRLGQDHKSSMFALKQRQIMPQKKSSKLAAQLSSTLGVCIPNITLPKRPHRSRSTRAWCSQRLSWCWKLRTQTITQQNWATLIRNRCMHQRTVPKTFHMLRKPLEGTAPCYPTDL